MSKISIFLNNGTTIEDCEQAQQTVVKDGRIMVQLMSGGWILADIDGAAVTDEEAKTFIETGKVPYGFVNTKEK